MNIQAVLEKGFCVRLIVRVELSPLRSVSKFAGGNFAELLTQFQEGSAGLVSMGRCK